MRTEDSDEDIVCLTPSNYRDCPNRGNLGQIRPNPRDRGNENSDESFGLANWVDVDRRHFANRPKREDETCWEYLTSETRNDAPRPREGSCNGNANVSQLPSPKGRKANSEECCAIPSKLRMLTLPSTSSNYYERLFQPTIVPNPLYKPPTPSVVPRATSGLKRKVRPKSPSMLKLQYTVDDTEPDDLPEAEIVPDLSSRSNVDVLSVPRELINVEAPEEVVVESAQTVLVELSDSDAEFEILDDHDAAYATQPNRLNGNLNCETSSRNDKHDDSKTAASKYPWDDSSKSIQLEAQVIVKPHLEFVPTSQLNPQDNFVSNEPVANVCNDTCHQDELQNSNNSTDQLEYLVSLTEKKPNVEPANSSQELKGCESLNNQEMEQSTSQMDSAPMEPTMCFQKSGIDNVEQGAITSGARLENAVITSKESNIIDDINPEILMRDEIFDVSNKSTLFPELEENDEEPNVEPIILCNQTSITHENIIPDQGSVDVADTVIVRGEDQTTLCDKEHTEELHVIAELEEAVSTRMNLAVLQPLLTENSVKENDTADEEVCSELPVYGEKPPESSGGQKLSKNVPPLQNFSAGINQVLYEPSAPAWYNGTFKRIKEVLSKRKIHNT
ncbi:unnamed protein product [Allacma fusca]|uniref:Uncharacterized protein n=1 Tax=Allacma fusca TaxID=39272 RepID=A0A8J2KB52_9HEXA|nr:unnamed protein product [Allacma fusca]